VIATSCDEAPGDDASSAKVIPQRMTKQRFASWRRAGLWLAMAAFALRLAVPAGFMLAPDASNHLVVTLCSATGPQTALMDLKTGEISPAKPVGDHQKKDKTDPPCAFAGLAVAALTPAETQIAAPLQQSAAIAATPAQMRPALVPTGPPLPARGPPTFA
jgi:hypothetical protein